MGFSKLQYGILLALEEEFGEDPVLVDDVEELSTVLLPMLFTGWIHQRTTRKQVQATIRRFIRGKYVKRYGKKMADMDDILKDLVRSVEKFWMEEQHGTTS